MKCKIPDDKECFELLADAELPVSIIRHSISVKNAALHFAEILKSRGLDVNKNLLSAAALLHDIKKMDAELCHGIEGGEFLRSKGYGEVGAVIEKHCLNNVKDPWLSPKTTEEKLLIYADLRVRNGAIVSLDERIDYIRKRYKPKDEQRFLKYIDFIKKMEFEFGFGE